MITGGRSYLKFQKDKYDVYTASEKKEMKKKRAKDQNLVRYYDAMIEEEKEILIKKTKAAVGNGVSDDIIKDFIIFHPALFMVYRDKDSLKKDTAKFYDHIKNFAGIEC